MCPSFSAGSPWSHWPSRTCWSTRSCCKCLICIRCPDHSTSHQLYLLGQQYHQPLYLPIVTPSSFTLCRVRMVSLVPEVSRVCLARREMKDQEDSLDLQAQLGCRCALQWKIPTVVKCYHLKNWENTIKSSAHSSGLAWSTWWERWNWRRWSNGKNFIKKWVYALYKWIHYITRLQVRCLYSFDCILSSV